MGNPLIGTALYSHTCRKFRPYEEISLKSHPEDIGYYLKGFGQDNDGEIYLAVSSMLGPQGNTGKVYKLVAAKDKNNTGY